MNNLEINLEMDNFCKNWIKEGVNRSRKKIPSEEIKKVFGVVIEPFENETHIYTDGSVERVNKKNKMMNKIGCASVKYIRKKYQLCSTAKYVSTMTYEDAVLAAEIESVHLIFSENMLRGNEKIVIIFIDSISAIEHIFEKKSEKFPSVEKIRKKIEQMKNTKFVLFYVPSHKGIEGNEKADEEARKARY